MGTREFVLVTVVVKFLGTAKLSITSCAPDEAIKTRPVQYRVLDDFVFNSNMFHIAPLRYI